MARGRHNNKKGRGGGGRGGRGRGRGGGGGGRGGGGRSYQDNRQSFDEVLKENEKMERFYNAIDIVPAGAERDAFWATMRRELPNSFRFTGSRAHALGVRDNLVTRFFPLISQIQHEGRPVEIPTPIPWYPEGLAYTMTTPKNVVRKYEPFKEFQRFLVSETGVGNISRQEQVSMIPPLLLDVRPEHAVLDLCAAPGSKSAQLVEAIHAGEEERVERAIRFAGTADHANGDGSNGVSAGAGMEDGGRSTGLLVANDVNYQRAQMLVHQVKRLNSPNLIVTNHDATMFPSIELPSTAPPPGSGLQKRGKYLKFDRILADVPCSGDGTPRKNPSIWKDWSPQNGLGLYITQVRILTRALQLLKAGGRVVYSTCSLNPMENEAVVSSAIERCGGVGKVKLLDCSAELPALVRSPGLTDWSIMSRGGQIYESFPEAEQHEPEGSKVVPGMFAPDPAEQIPLQHCMRVYPHQQDTGGFFIAVLEKLGEIRAKPESESKSMKRDWVFSAPEAEGVSVGDVEPAARTAFTQLLEDVEHPQPPSHTGGDFSSAAARQNIEISDDDQSTAGTKRKAGDELADGEEGATKKVKNGGEVESVPASRREHWPLPPSVALAVEAAGAQPGSEAVHMNGDVPINDEVTDAVAEAPVDKSVPTEAQQLPPPRRRRRDETANEEAFKYLSPTHPELESIYAFYELHASFPRSRFLVRNPTGDPVKGIYYSSQLVKEILTANEGRGMKFVHAGVKMFMKQDSQGQDICRWRIQTEGLPIIEGWVGEGRVVRLTRRDTLRKMLVEMFPKLGGDDAAEGTGWRALGEIGEQVLRMGMGCCVLRVVPTGHADGFSEPVTLPLWRSLHSLNLMLPKEDRRAMLLRIFNEDVELVNHSDASRAQRGNDGEVAGGSAPAEDDAKEVQRRIHATGNDDGGAEEDEEDDDDEERGVALYATAADTDALAEEDRVKAAEMEATETEDRKVADAMPEREGEGDEANTTV